MMHSRDGGHRVISRHLPTTRRPRPGGSDYGRKLRQRRVLDCLQILLGILLVFAAVWNIIIYHSGLMILPDVLFLQGPSVLQKPSRPRTVNYITDNATVHGMERRESSVAHQCIDLVLSMKEKSTAASSTSNSNSTRGRLKSCRYDADAGKNGGMYRVDPFGHCRRRSGGLTSMLLHNPFHLERIVCGRNIKGESSIVLTLEDVVSATSSSTAGSASGRADDDPWKCLEEPSRLYSTIPTIANAKKMPPILLGTTENSAESYKPIDWTCDVPCHKSIGFGKGLVKTIHINGPGYSWPFTHSMEGSAYYKQLTIDPEGYKNNKFHATTSFRSEVPLSYFSFEENHIQNAPVEYGKVIKGASFMARNCGSKSHREALVQGLIDFAGRLRRENNSETFRVDSLSSCLRNAVPPPGANMKDKVDVIRHYLFHLSFENSITEDYITEKLWGALDSGTLPVYLGAPNVKEHAPPNSIIHASDFDTPEALGEYLVKVANNQTLYESYHAWRSKPLPESFVRRYNHTHTHSECRFCRWAYARMYGLSFDHEAQALRDTRMPRQACMHGLREGQGMLTSPLFEFWRVGNEPMRNRLVQHNATYRSTCGTNKINRSVILSGPSGDMLQRSVWEHDGAIDVHVKAIGHVEPSTAFELTLRATTRSSGNYSTWATKGCAYMQSDMSRFKACATTGVSFRGGPPGGNSLSLTIPSETLPVRIRLLTEDVDTFHEGGDHTDSYFAVAMTRDFENPLEGFYIESGGD